MTWRLTSVVGTLALCVTTSCTTATTATVDLTDAASNFADDEALIVSASVLAESHTPSVQESTYTTLCVRKECTTVEMRYTRTFRETAAIAVAMRGLHELAQREKIDHDAQLVLQDAQRALPRMTDRIGNLLGDLAQLRPRHDFDDNIELTRNAERGLARAQSQIDEARALSHALGKTLQARFGIDEGIEVAWEDARTPEDPRAVLKRRLLAHSDLARELRRFDDKLDELALHVGLKELQRQLDVADRSAAAIAAIERREALAELRITSMHTVGPLAEEVASEWIEDARWAIAACLATDEFATDVALLYSHRGVVEGIELTRVRAAVNTCAKQSLAGTAITGVPLPSGGVLTFGVEVAP